MKRLYVITRADLPAGVQTAQAVHAAIAFVAENPTEAGQWMTESNTVVVASTGSRHSLGILEISADCARIDDESIASFREPALGHELTAIAFVCRSEEHARKLGLNKLKLTPA